MITKIYFILCFLLKNFCTFMKNPFFLLGGPYSKLVVSFHFKRLMGSFIIEVYAPSILLVVMSWVSFWINREATADRISLGQWTISNHSFHSSLSPCRPLLLTGTQQGFHVI